MAFGEVPLTLTHELVYQRSFGNLPHGTVYMKFLNSLVDPKGVEAEGVVDRRKEIKNILFPKTEVKAELDVASNLFAVGTSYSATSGSIPVIVPTVVDSRLYDVTRRPTPLASGLIPRVTNNGLFADYIKRTVIPTATFQAEGSSLSAANSTYVRTALAMSFLYAVGQLSGPLMAASRVWQDALNLEVEAQFRAVKYLEENTIINGNPTAGDVSGGTSDAKAFKGFSQSVTTNTQNKSSATILLNDIRDAVRTIREAYGEPDLMVTDYKTLNDLKALITDLLRYPAPTGNIAFGIESIVFEGVPVVPDLFMPTTANSREFHIYTVQKEANVQIRVLQEAAFEELAKTADLYKFMIKEYLTFIIVYEKWCFRIYNLA